ncbi:MAG: 3-hydroxyacyl-CoA dehydrogenase NAD-binding domain-containing protein, partial [Litorimonas sp.]
MTDVSTYAVENGIAIIEIDNPPVNALGVKVRQAIVARVEMAEADRDVDAIVFICAGRTFFAGADIKEFGKPPQSPNLPDTLTVLEQGQKPVIAAIHGTALGGGLELALHCNFRIAVPSARMGLPEVHLGILPGAGGTQRLPRLVGVPAALDLMTSGRQFNAQEALDFGVIDAVANADNLRGDAVAFARKVIDEKLPVKRVRDRQDMVEEYRGNTEIYDNFRQKNARKFRGFPAPENIIKAVQAAADLPYEAGKKRERELFLELQGSDAANAQRYAFFAQRAVAKIPDIAKDTAIRDIQSVGVIGAGTMGGGIAMNFLNIGLPVTLVEQTEEALERGIAVIRANYETSAKRGRISSVQVEERMGLISPTIDYAGLSDADLIIEAVFETMPIKKEVFGKIDKVAKAGAILASNTSYLDIDEIGQATSRPEDVVGLHFFSPANVMKLLEVVRTDKTSKDIINTSMKLAGRIGKTPVLSRVGYGFIANRVMSVRRTHSTMLALQGNSPETIDKVIYDYGFAMGPFQVLDLVGLDVLGRGSDEVTFWGEMVKRGRLGQKNKAGTYDYDDNRRRTLSSAAIDVLADVAVHHNVEPYTADADEILARQLYPIINEGAKVLDEGIALRASDIDMACIKGYNWPVYRGGPMFWADTIGLPKIVAKLREFESKYGADFTPSPLLVKLANEGGRLSDVTTF